MIPNFVLIRQTNPAPPAIEHAGQAVEESIRALNLDPKMFAGKRIGITVGSRGIDRIPELARAVVNVSRYAVNQVGGTALGGAMDNGLNPTTTLGCGTWGNNIISENLWYTHLMNVSRISYKVPSMYVPSDEEIWAE